MSTVFCLITWPRKSIVAAPPTPGRVHTCILAKDHAGNHLCPCGQEQAHE